MSLLLKYRNIVSAKARESSKVEDKPSKMEDACMHEFAEADGVEFCIKCGMTNNIAVTSEQEADGEGDTHDGGERPGTLIDDLLPKLSGSTMISGTNYNMDARQGHKFVLSKSKTEALAKVLRDIVIRTAEHKFSKAVITSAMKLYKDIHENTTCRGDNRIGLIAACVYSACKINDVAMTIPEIAKIFDVDKKRVSKGYGVIRIFLERRAIENPEEKSNPNFIFDMRMQYVYIDQICDRLELKEDIKNVVKSMIDNINSKSIPIENTPANTIIGCIFWIIKEIGLTIDAGTIIKKCPISKVTINKSYKNIRKYIDDILPIQDREILKSLSTKRIDESLEYYIPDIVQGTSHTL